MVQQGILVPSRSPYASNLLLVRKPDESEPPELKIEFVHHLLG